MSNSNHFPLVIISILVNPVTFSFGRAKLATSPPATGSTTFTNTIGISRVVRFSAVAAWVPLARITSGLERTRPAASVLIRSALPSPWRISRMIERPSSHPFSWRSERKAPSRTLTSGSLLDRGKSTPIRRTCSDCCARAESGHDAADPPISLMKSRRLIAAPKGEGIVRLGPI